MDQTRKMWASAAVVGVIVAGGVSIAAAASAGRLDQAAEETRAVVERQPAPSPGPSGGADDGVVVSEEVNPDPDKVFEYWTDDRMEGAEPMPMPVVTEGGVFHITE
ncbi:hypothetical protein Nocox_18960 [Nonomuraea coxensis DSM 45129]|uniref:Uncharacterized protein n=1 Tax=Nonomuraea coxensis DSM 45129 TaxID=1122611 RepID=A0ABX8U3D1_9ACTN|nr:hypothetical protein [Nonomuraea coxensis]QYC41401.1 hypothetical protein Nocox_18960 [Nonomuraea coxensis DSM 45129]